MIHLAAALVSCRDRVRQRCAWCGALLLETDAAAVAEKMSVGSALTIPYWPPGHYIKHVEGQPADNHRVIGPVGAIGAEMLGEDACMNLDPAVTS